MPNLQSLIERLSGPTRQIVMMGQSNTVADKTRWFAGIEDGKGVSYGPTPEDALCAAIAARKKDADRSQPCS